MNNKHETLEDFIRLILTNDTIACSLLSEEYGEANIGKVCKAVANYIVEHFACTNQPDPRDKLLENMAEKMDNAIKVFERPHDELSMSGAILRLKHFLAEYNKFKES